MQQTVTLTKHFPTHGNNSRGPWTRHDFKDAGGSKYQTFDAALGEKAAGLLNQPVEIEYEVEARGQYENNVLKSVKAAGGSPANPASVPSISQNVPSDERELRIMRQSGLDRAINTVNAGITTVSTLEELFVISDEYIRYFQNGVQEKF